MGPVIPVIPATLRDRHCGARRTLGLGTGRQAGDGHSRSRYLGPAYHCRAGRILRRCLTGPAVVFSRLARACLGQDGAAVLRTHAVCPEKKTTPSASTSSTSLPAALVLVPASPRAEREPRARLSLVCGPPTPPIAHHTSHHTSHATHLSIIHSKRQNPPKRTHAHLAPPLLLLIPFSSASPTCFPFPLPSNSSGFLLPFPVHPHPAGSWSCLAVSPSRRLAPSNNKGRLCCLMLAHCCADYVRLYRTYS